MRNRWRARMGLGCEVALAVRWVRDPGARDEQRCDWERGARSTLVGQGALQAVRRMGAVRARSGAIARLGRARPGRTDVDAGRWSAGELDAACRARTFAAAHLSISLDALPRTSAFEEKVDNVRASEVERTGAAPEDERRRRSGDPLCDSVARGAPVLRCSARRVSVDVDSHERTRRRLRTGHSFRLTTTMMRSPSYVLSSRGVL